MCRLIKISLGKKSRFFCPLFRVPTVCQCYQYMAWCIRGSLLNISTLPSRIHAYMIDMLRIVIRYFLFEIKNTKGNLAMKGMGGGISFSVPR